MPYSPQLHPRFLLTRRVGLAAFGALVLAVLGGAVYGLVEVCALVRAKPGEDALWESGETAYVPDDYQVEASTQQLFRSYKVLFTYRETGGQDHRGQVEVWTMFYDPIHYNRPPEVRYDPHLPERFVTSWQVESGWNRLGPPLTLLVGLGAVAAALSVEVRRLTRQLARLQRECPFGEWNLVGLATWTRPGPHGTTHRVFLAPATETRAAEERQYTSGGGPLFMDPDHTRLAALCLTTDPSLVVPLAEDLRPFLFSAGDEARLRGELGAT